MPDPFFAGWCQKSRWPSSGLTMTNLICIKDVLWNHNWELVNLVEFPMKYWTSKFSPEFLQRHTGITRESRTFAKPCHKCLSRRGIRTEDFDSCNALSEALHRMCRMLQKSKFHFFSCSWSHEQSFSSWQLCTMMQGKSRANGFTHIPQEIKNGKCLAWS